MYLLCKFCGFFSLNTYKTNLVCKMGRLLLSLNAFTLPETFFRFVFCVLIGLLMLNTTDYIATINKDLSLVINL